MCKMSLHFTRAMGFLFPSLDAFRYLSLLNDHFSHHHSGVHSLSVPPSLSCSLSLSPSRTLTLARTLTHKRSLCSYQYLSSSAFVYFAYSQMNLNVFANMNSFFVALLQYAPIHTPHTHLDRHIKTLTHTTFAESARFTGLCTTSTAMY